jgi:inner membrane protein
LDSVEDTEALQKLKRFSQQFYTAEKWNDTLVFNDLRFGQIMGWHDPKGKFVFHYFLKDSADNALVVQRGRLEGWNKDALNFLIDRMNHLVTKEYPLTLFMLLTHSFLFGRHWL